MKRAIEVNQPVREIKQRVSLSTKLLTPFVCSVLAALGIFGGISALFIGIVCVVVHGVMPNERNFDRVGTILLIVAIPMILVGSIFLDEINTKNS